MPRYVDGFVLLVPAKKLAAYKKLAAASPCKTKPAQRATQRRWRIPIQYTPKPCAAHTAAVQRPSSAKGTAKVTKPKPNAAKHSASHMPTLGPCAAARALRRSARAARQGDLPSRLTR